MVGFTTVPELSLVVVSRACSSFWASFVAEHRLWGMWSSIVVGTQASFLHRMWDLPEGGIEPTSPALAGRFLLTEPLREAPDLVLSAVFS